MLKEIHLTSSGVFLQAEIISPDGSALSGHMTYVRSIIAGIRCNELCGEIHSWEAVLPKASP